MQTYLTGGYIRDEMLGVPSHDRDFVVVGTTHEDMTRLGYKQVGADFPVYLSDSGEEFALARTERKNGNGHKGFIVNSDITVTIEGMNYICLDKKLLDQFQEAGFNIYDDYTIEELTQAFRRITQSGVRD